MGFPGGEMVKSPPANAGDVDLIPGSGKFPGERNGNPLQYSFLGNPTDREAWRATVHRVAKDFGLIPGLGRSLGRGNGNPIQYS